MWCELYIQCLFHTFQQLCMSLMCSTLYFQHSYVNSSAYSYCSTFYSIFIIHIRLYLYLPQFAHIYFIFSSTVHRTSRAWIQFVRYSTQNSFNVFRPTVSISTAISTGNARRLFGYISIQPQKFSTLLRRYLRLRPFVAFAIRLQRHFYFMGLSTVHTTVSTILQRISRPSTSTSSKQPPQPSTTSAARRWPFLKVETNARQLYTHQTEAASFSPSTSSRISPSCLANERFQKKIQDCTPPFSQKFSWLLQQDRRMNYKLQRLQYNVVRLCFATSKGQQCSDSL